MDLKALREQAINEANDEFQEEKINRFKSDIKSIIYKISKNNAEIAAHSEANEKLKKKIS